jgi:hypothetical protein
MTSEIFGYTGKEVISSLYNMRNKQKFSVTTFKVISSLHVQKIMHQIYRCEDCTSYSKCNQWSYDKSSPNTCKTMHVLFLRRLITTVTTFKEIISQSLICTAQLNPKTITLYDVTPVPPNHKTPMTNDNKNDLMWRSNRAK